VLPLFRWSLTASLIGSQVIGRALDRARPSNVESLALSISSFRQIFCFLVRSEELPAALQGLEFRAGARIGTRILSPIVVD